MWFKFSCCYSQTLVRMILIFQTQLINVTKSQLTSEYQTFTKKLRNLEIFALAIAQRMNVFFLLCQPPPSPPFWSHISQESWKICYWGESIFSVCHEKHFHFVSYPSQPSKMKKSFLSLVQDWYLEKMIRTYDLDP